MTDLFGTEVTVGDYVIYHLHPSRGSACGLGVGVCIRETASGNMKIRVLFCGYELGKSPLHDVYRWDKVETLVKYSIDLIRVTDGILMDMGASQEFIDVLSRQNYDEFIDAPEVFGF